MAGKQIKFPEKMTHTKQFEMAMWILTLACVVFVIIAIYAVGGGGFPAE